MVNQFTSEQVSIMRTALDMSAAILRHHIRESIDAGEPYAAGLYSVELVRVERAAHIAWNLSEHFPTEN